MSSSFISSTVDSLVQGVKSMAASEAQAMLNTTLPHDFEYYMVALELVDGSGNTIDYFAFPIMPSSIQKTEPKRTNIKQTGSGVTVVTNTAFTPQQIVLKGNFGKYFKILLSPKVPEGLAVAYSIQNGKYDLYQSNANWKGLGGIASGVVNVKNGFGALNILRAIISKSNGLDSEGRPFRLYFYNMAMSESYLVTVPANGLVVDSNVHGNNFLWNYNLTLTVLAPLDLVLGSKGLKSSLTKLASANSVQKGINAMTSSLRNLIM